MRGDIQYMYNLHHNPVLIPHQARILTLFFKSHIGQQFFLTGGTALAAFYLAHRKSEDLDLFTVQPFDSLHLTKAIQNILEETSSHIERQLKTPRYWELYLRNKTDSWIQRLDFVHEQPIIFGKQETIDGVIVDSLENIASNKILAIYGRLEPKDYLDFYWICQETKLDFFQLFEKTKKKDTGLHEFYFANIIADVEKLTRMPETLKPFNLLDLQHFYLGLSKQLLKKIKPDKSKM
ncbi:MAG: hypothetical protein UU14_C0023G0025 [Candidatus Roizmanbacteria bacterium GW2011_GWB1_40_7]|uniref:Nucleotidyl transferase AbiEii/AbiGii toxin family protein n=2 Tax=Candidatus Roizmaniibacteriota TaxID=1752723 RepID=A0A0G0VI01_9BACT|nr:MAG: hypothetical protein UU14_C0023G0025 [Candidatus Roizmanbacteria bacterium GW2011_GWB1_40_7]KKR92817.1 MAG: hypothetical protein UU41_C0023G0019 [Candidatus Roizmanbacteria bacterium GW2011_GWA1_41_13]